MSSMPRMRRAHAEALAPRSLDPRARAFAERDAAAMARLHGEHALFVGSRPQLYVGRGDGRSCCAWLRPHSSNHSRFGAAAAEALADPAGRLAATVWFAVDHPPISQTLVCEDGPQRAAPHHASPPTGAT